MKLSNMIRARDRLKKWKETSPQVSQKLLKKFLETLIYKVELDKSKLFLIVRDIAETQIQSFIDSSTQSEQIEQFKKVIDLAKEVLDIFKYAIIKTKLQKKIIEQPDCPSEEVDCFIPLNKLCQDIFESYQEVKGQKIKPYLSAISKQIISNLGQEHLNIEQVKSITMNMVKEIQSRHQGDMLAEKNFKSDIKTLLIYIKRDKGGFVIKALLRGELTVAAAALLRSSDWASQEMKDEERRLQQSSYETENTQYAKNLYESFQKSVLP